MKKICPIMSVTVAAKANNIKDIPVTWKGIACLEENCALWVPELECCTHRLGKMSIPDKKPSKEALERCARWLTHDEREMKGIAWKRAQDGNKVDADAVDQAAEDAHSVAAYLRLLAGGQGGAAHPDQNPDAPDPSSEEDS